MLHHQTWAGNKSLTKAFFCNPKRDLSLVPGPVCFLESCPLKEVGIFDKFSMSYLFSLSRHQTKCFIKMSSKAMADRKKRGEDRNTKV